MMLGDECAASHRSRGLLGKILLGMSALLVWGTLAAAEGDRITVEIEQSRGVDRTLDYKSLLAFGPWDDRNYALTKADLAVLGPKESSITDPIPAFFRVAIRKANPQMPRDSSTPYPLSALNGFLMMHYGYQYNGKLYSHITREDDGSFVFIDAPEHEGDDEGLLLLGGEVKVSSPAGAAETAIAINPVNPNILVAGSNGPNPAGDTTIRQKMWFSSDAGATWTRSQPLSTTAGGNVCCDPTVSWSTDGTKAYGSALINCGTGCGIRFYRSDDNGNVWGDTDPGTSAPPPVDIVASGADKQFIHVDASSTSAHRDVVHLCWHESNVNQYARSSNFGVSFSPKITIDSAGRGVGCDLTTDRAGNVYYFYPGLDSGAAATQKRIRFAKSTDGGATFPTVGNAATTNDSFNYPLPSMETRKVAKIVQADADISTGPFSNSVYVIWPDITATESATAANNHSQVIVAYTRDGGSTWQTSIPHPVSDVNTVDRYQPSIKVDDLGRVHVIYYDTRHSTSRNGVDVYYNVSYDGAATWGTERRITTVTSDNINDSFEFGDYSHMDGVLDQLITIFTDNRSEAGGPIDKDAYAAGGFADPFTPTYVPSILGSVQTVCAGQPLAPVTLTMRSIMGYTTPVNLTTPGLSADITSPSFSVNPVTPSPSGSASVFNATLSAAAAAGPITITLRGTSTDPAPIIKDNVVQVTAANPLASGPALTSPANAAVGVSTSPTLTWAAVAGAESYTVQISTSSDFSVLVANATVTGTSFKPALSLAGDTHYFWRVRASNACGNSAFTAAREFTTAEEYCVSPGLAIPDNNLTGVSNTITVPEGGAVTDLDVDVKITHSFIGDLRLSLVHVASNTTVRLITNPSGCSGDDMDTTFDDEAALTFACSAGVPTVGAGPFRPQDALTAMDGRTLAGDWRLTLIDSAGQDVGTLDTWCLIPAANAAQPEELFENGFE
jgi:subtilisin-like proprotein convertase family protein